MIQSNHNEPQEVCWDCQVKDFLFSTGFNTLRMHGLELLQLFLTPWGETAWGQILRAEEDRFIWRQSWNSDDVLNFWIKLCLKSAILWIFLFSEPMNILFCWETFIQVYFSPEITSILPNNMWLIWGLSIGIRNMWFSMQTWFERKPGNRSEVFRMQLLEETLKCLREQIFTMSKIWMNN